MSDIAEYRGTRPTMRQQRTHRPFGREAFADASAFLGSYARHVLGTRQMVFLVSHAGRTHPEFPRDQIRGEAPDHQSVCIWLPSLTASSENSTTSALKNLAAHHDHQERRSFPSFHDIRPRMESHFRPEHDLMRLRLAVGRRSVWWASPRTRRSCVAPWGSGRCPRVVRRRPYRPGTGD